jgi:hypothetical protein
MCACRCVRQLHRDAQLTPHLAQGSLHHIARPEFLAKKGDLSVPAP